MRMAMVALRYVSLISGTWVTDFGHHVVGVDKDRQKIAELQAGRIPIFERGLGDLVRANARLGRLSFKTEVPAAIWTVHAVIIAVCTPSRRGDGFADLSFVYAAARKAASPLGRFTVVVTKSTVPVGTGDEVERIIRKTRPDAKFAVVCNPEFLREGAAINDFKWPDPMVVGTEDARAEQVMRGHYWPLYLDRAPILVDSRRTAELTKYVANASLAAKFTFINEVANLCEQVSADMQDVVRGIGLDNRIASKFLHVGPGYMDSFRKGTLALIRTAQEAGSPQRMVKTVVSVNDERKAAMGRNILAACGGSERGKTLAVLDLTFKPNTDDLRDAPALAIIPHLQEAGAHIRAYDPEGMEGTRPLLPGVELEADPYACIEAADALVFVIEWDAFHALDLGEIRSRLRAPVLVNLRNIYPPQEAARHGLDYTEAGKPRVAGQART